MASTYRVNRSDGVIVVSGLDATDAALTIIDAPPSAGTYTYTLEVYSAAGGVSRTLSIINVLLVKR